MQTVLGIFLVLVAVWLIVHIIVQARHGTVDTFSTRNFFLLGFIVFQLTSGALTLWTGFYDALQCADYAKTGAIYTVMVMIFLVLFMNFYRWGRPAASWAASVRPRYGTVGPYAMLLMAALFAIGGVVWRMLLTQIPVFGVLAITAATGLAAAAAGLAAWVWAPRWNNPLIGVVALTIICVSLVVVFYGDFGRRNSLDIFMACLLGAHQGHWKNIGLKRARTQVVTLGAAALIFMAAFTAGRKSGLSDRNLDIAGSVARLGQGDLGEGFLQMASGQAAAACSMWLIETRPDPFPYDTFHTFRYFIFHPIPRIIWEDKPSGLGSEMRVQGSVRNRSKEFSFGPGLMGHIVNDNPWLCMVPYAFMFALMSRFVDQLIRLNPGNPFIIIPLSVGLGEVIGLARGEAGYFLSRVFIMTIGAWISMAVLGMILKSFGVVSPPAVAPPFPGEEGEPGEHDPQGLVDPDLAADYESHSDSERAA